MNFIHQPDTRCSISNSNQLVLVCIDADVCGQTRVGKLLTRSTNLSFSLWVKSWREFWKNRKFWNIF